MNTITLTLEGMSCGHCVGRVKKTLERLGDVRIEDVQVGTARITLAGGPEALDTPRFAPCWRCLGNFSGTYQVPHAQQHSST